MSITAPSWSLQLAIRGLHGYHRAMSMRLQSSIFLFAFLVVPPIAAAQAPAANSSATYDNEPAEVWLARLTDKDDAIRIRSAYALGRISPPSRETVAALIKGVDDRAQEVRWYSAD